MPIESRLPAQRCKKLQKPGQATMLTSSVEGIPIFVTEGNCQKISLQVFFGIELGACQMWLPSRKFLLTTVPTSTLSTRRWIPAKVQPCDQTWSFEVNGFNSKFGKPPSVLARLWIKKNTFLPNKFVRNTHLRKYNFDKYTFEVNGFNSKFVKPPNVLAPPPE